MEVIGNKQKLLGPRKRFYWLRLMEHYYFFYFIEKCPTSSTVEFSLNCDPGKVLSGVRLQFVSGSCQSSNRCFRSGDSSHFEHCIGYRSCRIILQPDRASFHRYPLCARQAALLAYDCVPGKIISHIKMKKKP